MDTPVKAKPKMKLYGFNNLTKTLSFNIYDICYTRTEEEKKQYIQYIDEVYNCLLYTSQGRFTRPEELNVCWQARLINRFIHPDGSMASIYGMQSAMNLDGKWKVLGAFILGAIAKIFRKPGVFYAIARAASLTDDVTGTMPPFDKHIRCV